MLLLGAGNFVSWPLLEDQISRFHHNIKPYWLTPPLAKVKEHGLLAENALWSAKSNRLYLFCCALPRLASCCMKAKLPSWMLLWTLMLRSGLP